LRRYNEGGEAPFTCPGCILSQLERKERTPTTTRQGLTLVHFSAQLEPFLTQ
jgi:hypothetical protein